MQQSHLVLGILSSVFGTESFAGFYEHAASALLLRQHEGAPSVLTHLV